MTPARRARRGFSLLFAAGMLVVLSFGAQLLLSQVMNVGVLVGARQRSMRSGQAAQTGCLYGVNMLNALLYVTPTAPMNLTLVRALPTLPAGDPVCADGVDCRQWRLLADGQVTGLGASNSRIAVTCSPGGCGVAESQVVTFRVRTLSTLPGGGTELLEVFVEPS